MFHGRVADAHHGQVVTLRSILHKCLDGSLHRGYHLLWRHAVTALQHLHGPLHAELVTHRTTSLRQSVGIEEQRLAGSQRHRLLLVAEVIEYTDRQVGRYRQTLQLQAVSSLPQTNRHIMTGITVAQMSRRQVEHADEQRDKHVRAVILARHLVDGLHNTVGVFLTGRCHAEQRVNHRHDHCRGHALARHVTDAEEEFLVA